MDLSTVTCARQAYAANFDLLPSPPPPQAPVAAIAFTFAAADGVMTAVILLRERLLPLWCGPAGAAYTLSVLAHHAALGDLWGAVGSFGLGLMANHGLLAGWGILALSVHAAVTGRLSRAKAHRVIAGDLRAYEAAWAALVERDAGGALVAAGVAEAAACRDGEGGGGGIVRSDGNSVGGCGGSRGGGEGGARERASIALGSGGGGGGSLALLAETVAELSLGIPRSSSLRPLRQRTPPWQPKPPEDPQRPRGRWPMGTGTGPPDTEADCLELGGGTAGEPVASLEQLLAQSAGLDIFLRCKASGSTFFLSPSLSPSFLVPHFLTISSLTPWA